MFGSVSGNRVFATRQKVSFNSWAISKSPVGLRWGLIPSMHPHTRDCNLHILDNPKIISRMKCHPGHGIHWTPIVSPFLSAFHEVTQQISNKTSDQNEIFQLNLKDSPQKMFTVWNMQQWLKRSKIIGATVCVKNMHIHYPSAVWTCLIGGCHVRPNTLWFGCTIICKISKFPLSLDIIYAGLQGGVGKCVASARAAFLSCGFFHHCCVSVEV